MNGLTRIGCPTRRRAIAAVAVVLGVLTASSAGRAQDIAAGLQDPIVGSWVGQVAQPDLDPFPVRLTFVSPKGGVSRYPSEPTCGGMLSGDRKGESYEYQETITFGGGDERPDGCLNGTIALSIDGDTMKYNWATNYDGKDFSSSGELKRQTSAKKR